MAARSSAATPVRWILRSLVALVGIAICVAAAVWQYHRAEDQVVVGQAAVTAAVPYGEIMPGQQDGVPVEAMGRLVTVTGTAEPPHRSLIRSRQSADGQPGYFVVDGVSQPDGSLVAVLQGWVADVRDAPRPAVADADRPLTGRVQPDENFYPSAPISTGDPLVTITHAGLATQWGGQDIRPGYVTATSPAAAFQRVTPVIGSDPDPPFPWQNAFYAVQWLVFAGLVGFVWFRWVRADIADERAAARHVQQQHEQEQHEPRVSL